MPIMEALWITGVLALPLVVLAVIMRRRSRTADYIEGRAVRADLPWWVRNCETLMILAFGHLWGAVSFKLFHFFQESSLGANGPSRGATAVYVGMGIIFIVVPMAMLSSNVASWCIPFLRAANQEAFRGTHVSFKSANAGLAKFASISVSFGLLLLLAAAIEPWNR
ncbi:MAG: hypothetical protein ACKOOL_03765 [Novosphingobium sp.]